eukprot:31538-Pelagococcus_subviridis.AAC.4
MSVRIGVHIANAVVWEPVYRTHLRELLDLPRRLEDDATAATLDERVDRFRAVHDRATLRPRVRRERLDVLAQVSRVPRPLVAARDRGVAAEEDLALEVVLLAGRRRLVPRRAKRRPRELVRGVRLLLLQRRRGVFIIFRDFFLAAVAAVAVAVDDDFLVVVVVVVVVRVLRVVDLRGQQRARGGALVDVPRRVRATPRQGEFSPRRLLLVRVKKPEPLEVASATIHLTQRRSDVFGIGSDRAASRTAFEVLGLFRRGVFVFFFVAFGGVRVRVRVRLGGYQSRYELALLFALLFVVPLDRRGERQRERRALRVSLAPLARLVKRRAIRRRVGDDPVHVASIRRRERSHGFQDGVRVRVRVGDGRRSFFPQSSARRSKQRDRGLQLRAADPRRHEIVLVLPRQRVERIRHRPQSLRRRRARADPAPSLGRRRRLLRRDDGRRDGRRRFVFPRRREDGEIADVRARAEKRLARVRSGEKPHPRDRFVAAFVPAVVAVVAVPAAVRLRRASQRARRRAVLAPDDDGPPRRRRRRPRARRARAHRADHLPSAQLGRDPRGEISLRRGAVSEHRDVEPVDEQRQLRLTREQPPAAEPVLGRGSAVSAVVEVEAARAFLLPRPERRRRLVATGVMDRVRVPHAQQRVVLHVHLAVHVHDPLRDMTLERPEHGVAEIPDPRRRDRAEQHDRGLPARRDSRSSSARRTRAVVAVVVAVVVVVVVIARIIVRGVVNAFARAAHARAVRYDRRRERVRALPPAAAARGVRPPREFDTNPGEELAVAAARRDDAEDDRDGRDRDGDRDQRRAIARSAISPLDDVGGGVRAELGRARGVPRRVRRRRARAAASGHRAGRALRCDESSSSSSFDSAGVREKQLSSPYKKYTAGQIEAAPNNAQAGRSFPSRVKKRNTGVRLSFSTTQHALLLRAIYDR